MGSCLEQRLFESSADDESSRASTPDEMTPSLSSQRRQYPVKPDLCVSCIAAKAAALSTQIKQPSTSNEDQGSSNLQILSSHDKVYNDK